MKRLLVLLVALSVVFSAYGAEADSSGLSRWLYEIAKKMPHSSAPDETREQYEERLAEMTKSVAVATKPYSNGQGWTTTELGLAVLELWNGETLFDQRIHAGLEHPKWTSDNGKAKCMGQIHISLLVPKEQWEKLVGTDQGATQLCADATARLIVAHARSCGVWAGQRADRMKVAKTFAAYGSGGKCVPGERDFARADKWNAFIARRPDRSPLPGFRRAGPSELSPPVLEESSRIASMIGSFPGAQPGAAFEFKTPTAEYKLRIERHADSRVGVSVFVKD